MTDTRDPDLLSGLRLTVYYVGRLKKERRMCLRKKHDEPMVAREDIEVWKVLDSGSIAPHQAYRYRRGLNVPDVPSRGVGDTGAEIGPGWLHAFRYRDWAIGEAELLSLTSWYDNDGKDRVFTAVRMLIPRGSKYYIGRDGDICSSALYWPEEGTAHPNPVEFK